MSMKLYIGSTPLLPTPKLGNVGLTTIYQGNTLMYGEPIRQPKDILGLQNWWRADLGITLSGSRVTQWDDQINGKSLTLESGSSAPDWISADSGMNDRPAIHFGNNATNESLSDNANPISTSLSDIPFLYFVISYEPGSYGSTEVYVGGDNRVNTPGQNYRILTNNFDYQNRFIIQATELDQSGTTTAPQETIPSSYNNWVGIGWKNTPNRDGYWYHNGTETEWFSEGTDQWGRPAIVSSGIKLVVGNAGPGNTGVFRGKVLEMGFALQKPNATELAEFNEYVNRRYGL